MLQIIAIVPKQMNFVSSNLDPGYDNMRKQT